MSGPDATAQAALAADPAWPVWIAFLDILGDPIRVTTAPYGLSFPAGSTGDADLDGHSFDAIDPTFVSVTSVQQKEGGAETFTVTLSGLIGVDTQLLNQIGNKANWQGRSIRLWSCMFDTSLNQLGAIWPRHTGYMTVPRITGDRTGQVIVLDTESYLRFLTGASNRSYLNQADYDSGDLSAAASIACANGQSAAGAGVSTAVDMQTQMRIRSDFGPANAV